MKLTRETTELTALFEAAAKQRRFIRYRNEDKDLVNDGWRIFFAVDTDVIKLFTDPIKNSVASKALKEGYAQIFPKEPTSLSINIGRLLANFIFTKLGKKHPLLSIPPLDQELNRVITGIARDAEKERQTAEIELKKLHAILEELKYDKNAEDVLDELQELAPSLHTLLVGGTGPTAELGRIGQLMKNHWIAPLPFAVETGLIDDLHLRNAWKKVDSFLARIEIHDFRETWVDRLKASKHALPISKYDDANVLAHLEWLNQNLETYKCRVLYITGDMSIFRAAEVYKLNGERSFAALYLRHPRSYLFEPEIFLPDESTLTERIKKENDLINWLDTFLAFPYKNSRKNRLGNNYPIDHEMMSYREAAEDALKERPQILAEFYQKWVNYTQNVAFAHGPGAIPRCFGKADKLEELRKTSMTLKDVLDKLRSNLSARVNDTWNLLFVVASEAGLWLQIQRNINNDLPPRDVPVLSFKSLPIAKELADSFIDNVLVARMNDTTPDSKIYRETLKKLQDEDSSQYSAFLIFGLLFASEGNWHITAILSKRALDIAENSNQWNLTGREAAYLLAVSLRYSAHSVQDLDSVKYFLHLAETNLEKERTKREKLTGGEIRFLAENHALHLTHHLFRLFVRNYPESEVSKLPTLTQVQHRITSLLDNFAKTQAEQDEKIRKSVERHLLTNLFMIVFLRTQKEHAEMVPENFRQYYTSFKANMNSSNNPPFVIESFIVRSIFMVTEWWIEKNEIKKKKKAREISRLINQHAINNNTVLPYDKERFLFLLEFSSSGAGPS